MRDIVRKHVFLHVNSSFICLYVNLKKMQYGQTSDQDCRENICGLNRIMIEVRITVCVTDELGSLGSYGTAYFQDIAIL